MKRQFLVAALLLVSVVSATVLAGCRSKACARMEVCCQAIEGTEGVGGACGRASAAVGDPETCRTILKTVRFMFDDRDESPPEACRELPEG